MSAEATGSAGLRRGSRTRLVWPVVMSTLINLIVWATFDPRLVFKPEARQGAVVAASVRLEHQRVGLLRRKRRPPTRPHTGPKQSLPPRAIISRGVRLHPARKTPAADVSGALISAPNQVVRLKLPPTWATLDLGEATAENSAIWLDFKQARGAFVPRIMVMKLKTTYLSGPSLQDAVHDIVDGLAAEGAKMHASRAQAACGGTHPGWFLSYDKPQDDPPWDFDEVLVLQGDTVYRITYSRPNGAPEDAKTRAALKTLCPLHRS